VAATAAFNWAKLEAMPSAQTKRSDRLAAVESENVAALRAMIELFNKGELEELLDRFAAEDIELDFSRSSTDQAAIFRGFDGARHVWEAGMEPWQDFELIADEYIEVRDDTVVVASHSRSVGRGSGVEVVARGATLFRLRNGKIFLWQLHQSKAEALEACAGYVGS
jgi:ketosteroid isomerase-like protein